MQLCTCLDGLAYHNVCCAKGVVAFVFTISYDSLASAHKDIVRSPNFQIGVIVDIKLLVHTRQ